MNTVRRVCRNVKRWRSASMTLRWTASMQEAAKGFQQLKAHKKRPTLRHWLKAQLTASLLAKSTPSNVNPGSVRFNIQQSARHLAGERVCQNTNP